MSKKSNAIVGSILGLALLGGTAGVVLGVPEVKDAVFGSVSQVEKPPIEEDEKTPENSQEDLLIKITDLSNKLNSQNELLITRNSQIADLSFDKNVLESEKIALELQLELAKENAVLYEQTQQQLAETTSALDLATAELEQARIDNNLSAEEIASLEQNVTHLTNEKTSLESTISNLDAEIEYYKELLGENINYANLVVELQTSLDEKTSALETTSAELEILTSEHNELLTLVAELQTELAQVKEQLSNYVASSTLDKLQIENYDGTWYLNGTFEDYLIIENGIVTRGLNVDSGALQVMYNEMFMLLNNGGGQKITLADNGTKITLADGSEYTKFAVNTISECKEKLSYIVGTYSYGSEQIILNADKVCSYFNGDSTIYGSYTVKAFEKNVGGNITYYQTVTATFYDDNSNPIVKTFEIVDSNHRFVVDNKDFVGISFECYFNSDSYSIPTNGLKVTAFLEDTITVDAGKFINIYFKTSYLPGYSSSNTSSYGPYMNGSSYYLVNNTGKTIKTNVVTFYVTFFKMSKPAFSFDGISTVASQTPNSIIYEEIGDADNGMYHKFSDDFIKKYIDKVAYYKSCNTISEYYVGSYLNEETVISLAEDGTATIGELAGTYTATAKTDGTNIVHIVTVTYEETQIAEDETEVTVTHTLTFDLTNNTFAPANATLDGTEITLIKANV